MHLKIKLKYLFAIYFYLLIGCIIILNYPRDIDSILSLNYVVDTIAYFIMTGIFLLIIFKNKLDIFDPIVFISVIYITMFTIVPIIDILSGEILWFGVDLFPYGFKGTSLAVIGYIFFCLGYSISIRRRRPIKEKNNDIIQRQYDINKIILLSLLAWVFCFILSMIYVMASGKSLMYIFSLGLKGDFDATNISSTPLGFISMFSYSLLPTCLIYSNYGNSKSIKILLFIGTFIIQLIRGFRFTIVILILSYIYFYYLKNKKRPTGKTILLLLIIIFITIGIMGFYRGDLRSGNSVNWDEFSLDDINDAILGNFRIYKTYYAVIKAVPSMTSYMYGQQMFVYTIVMFIPRVIWPSKPSPHGGDAIKLGISDYAKIAGQAYPNIGEFYYEFGIIGVIFFMWLFGFWMSRIKRKYFYSTDQFDLIIYSIIIPATLQLIIRGYTPSNFYLIVFIIAPVILIKKYSKFRYYK